MIKHRIQYSPITRKYRPEFKFWFIFIPCWSAYCEYLGKSFNEVESYIEFDTYDEAMDYINKKIFDEAKKLRDENLQDIENQSWSTVKGEVE